MVSWTTLVTGIIGGVIGVSGTSLGAWLTGKTQTANLKLSINADREHAQIADKRQIYARCLASLTEVVFAAANLDDYGDDISAEERRSLALAMHESLASMVVSMSGIRLVAPESLGDLAEDIGRKVTRAAVDIELHIDSNFDFTSLRRQLYQAMRADLDADQQRQATRTDEP